MLDKFVSENKSSGEFCKVMFRILKSCRKRLDESRHRLVSKGAIQPEKGENEIVISDGQKARQKEQVIKMIDCCYKTVLEARSDQLSIQLVLIDYETNKDESEVALKRQIKMSRDVKHKFKEATERVADETYACGKFKISSAAKELCNFLQIIPKEIYMGKPSTFKSESDRDSDSEDDEKPVKPKKKAKAKKMKKEDFTYEPTPAPKKKGRPPKA